MISPLPAFNLIQTSTLFSSLRQSRHHQRGIPIATPDDVPGQA
ncbi:hypothetical protein ACQPT2_20830 [Erwinia amylovora]